MDDYATCDDLEIFTQHIQTMFLWTPYNGQLLGPCVITCAQTSIFPLLHTERDVFFLLEAKEIRDACAQDGFVFPRTILVARTHICPSGTLSMRFNSILNWCFCDEKEDCLFWTVNKNSTLQQHFIIK